MGQSCWCWSRNHKLNNLKPESAISCLSRELELLLWVHLGLYLGSFFFFLLMKMLHIQSFFFPTVVYSYFRSMDNLRCYRIEPGRKSINPKLDWNNFWCGLASQVLTAFWILVNLESECSSTVMTHFLLLPTEVCSKFQKTETLHSMRFTNWNWYQPKVEVSK